LQLARFRSRCGGAPGVFCHREMRTKSCALDVMKQFRRDLKRGYDDAKDTLQDWTEEAKDRVRDAKERVRDVAERGADLAGDLRDAARDKVEPLRRVVNRG